jgi:hypothetical protein
MPIIGKRTKSTLLKPERYNESPKLAHKNIMVKILSFNGNGTPLK